jgi:hypothetical protein
MKNPKESKLSGENLDLYCAIIDHVNGLKKTLEGRVLTIAEASTQDPEQRASLKSLVREAIWMETHWSSNLLEMVAEHLKIPKDQEE